MHDRGFCCHGDINSRLPAQTHNWVRIERWRGAVKIPLMKVEHQSCCRRLQSTHNQMKCLAEKTLQQERASYPAITSGTFQNGPWDDLTYFFSILFSSACPGSPPLWLVGGPLSFTVTPSQFSCPLSCSPRHVPLPPNDANQFSQEIRTRMTSRACCSRLIRPIWTTDKSKRFLPLVPSAEILLKICSCLLQSVPHLLHWCSIFSFLGGGYGLVLVVCMGGRGCIIKGICSLEALCGTGIISVPG